MTDYRKVKEIAYEDMLKAMQKYSSCNNIAHSNQTMSQAELEMKSAMQNYLHACYAEMHSNSVKRGIKAAKERKSKQTEREANNND